MDFKRDEKAPKGRLIPMYLSDDGDLYSLRFKDQDQLEEISTMMGIFLSGVIGSPLVLDGEPLNEDF